jgi:hypothetical protein
MRRVHRACAAGPAAPHHQPPMGRRPHRDSKRRGKRMEEKVRPLRGNCGFVHESPERTVRNLPERAISALEMAQKCPKTAKTCRKPVIFRRLWRPLRGPWASKGPGPQPLAPYQVSLRECGRRKGSVAARRPEPAPARACRSGQPSGHKSTAQRGRLRPSAPDRPIWAPRHRHEIAQVGQRPSPTWPVPNCATQRYGDRRRSGEHAPAS